MVKKIAIKTPGIKFYQSGLQDRYTMKNKIIYAGILVMTIISAISIPVLADTLLNEGKQISSNQFAYYSFSGTKDTKIDVNFTISSGGAVNLLLMDSANYNTFSTACSGGTSGTFQYYIAGSSLSSVSKSYSFTLPETQTYYVIIDNAGCASGGATPSGSVTYHITISSGSAASPGFELPIFFGTILTVGLVYTIQKKRQ